METRGPASAAAPVAAPPEELSWQPAVALAGESRPPSGAERGFALRLHGDPACGHRLMPGVPLISRAYEQVRADTLCPHCTAGVVLSATSSVLRRLRDAERTLQRLRETADQAPVPREIVHCRALRHEAGQAVSLHPSVMAYAAEVADLAGEVAEVLREALRTALSPR